jgi:hypothetical protein
MNANEKSRFDVLYAKHLRALKLQGKAPTTVFSFSSIYRIGRYCGIGLLSGNAVLSLPVAGSYATRIRTPPRVS